MKLKIFSRNKEAGVKIVSIVIVIIIIALALSVYFLVSPGSSKYWEDSFAGGSWGQEIILTYADGTLQSVKPMLEPGAVYDLNKEVSHITYKLSGKASGNEYSSVKIKTSGYMVNVENRKQPQQTVVDTYTCLGGDTIKTINVDDAWHEVATWVISVGELFAPGLDDGPYMVFFKPDGILQYQVGSSAYQNADTPSSIYIILNVIGGSTGSFVISFKGEAGTK